MLLTYKGAEVELPGASQESSELRQELAEEEGGEACRRTGAVVGEIGEAGVVTVGKYDYMFGGLGYNFTNSSHAPTEMGTWLRNRPN